MSTLGRRVECLERRRPRLAPCPEHATAMPSRDYRDALGPFLPPEVRAELPEPEVPPPCERCGWRWEFAFDVVAREDWGPR